VKKRTAAQGPGTIQWWWDGVLLLLLLLFHIVVHYSSSSSSSSNRASGNGNATKSLMTGAWRAMGQRQQGYRCTLLLAAVQCHVHWRSSPRQSVATDP
jgi:hypothetical protein